MTGGVTGVRRYLFELLPDLYPEGFLTNTEIETWALFMRESNGR